MPQVSVKKLRKVYGNKVVVDDLSFDAPEGKLTTLLGPSGSGKSTVIRMIAGLEKPDGGEIWLGDKRVYVNGNGEEIPSERRQIGMVFQSYALWPHKSVFNNIAFPLSVRHIKKSKIIEKVKKSMELVNLAGYEKRFPGQLSGGEQQRVALARALVYEPEILLLDEPLANLDALIREQVRFELLEIQRRTGITMIYVTHDQSEAMVISDTVIILNEGRIMQEGSPREVFDWPQNKFIANFLGVNNLIQAVYRDRTSAELPDGRVLYWQEQRERTDAFLEGDSVYLSIRPNQIRISGNEIKDAPNILKGTVVKEVYVGAMTEYWVESGSLKLRVQQQETTGTREGDGIYISINPRFLRLLPQE